MKSTALKLVLFLGLIWSLVPAASSAGEAAADAQSIRPLLLGSSVPEVSLRDLDGQIVELAKLVSGKPSVLIFYRGGWWPYCNTQLGQLLEIEDELKELGYQVVAISPDRPEKMSATAERHKMGYLLLSDSQARAALAFGLAFKLDDRTYSQYEGYGINLEDASGEKHHILPVPAVFVVNEKGAIEFEYVNPDYKVRVPSEVLLAAAKAALGG